MADLRLFVAVPISDELRRKIAEVQEEFKRAAADVKWVDPANFHITVKFLGGVDEQRLDAIDRALSASVEGVRPFELSVAGAGAFPGLSRPQVVWIGLEDGVDQLRELAGRVEDALYREGYPKEDRKFKAHLTIGRVREGRNARSLPDVIKVHAADRFGMQSVDKIALMRSDLRKEGPIYTALRDYSFPGA